MHNNLLSEEGNLYLEHVYSHMIHVLHLSEMGGIQVPLFDIPVPISSSINQKELHS